MQKSDRRLKLKEEHNNIFSTDEILWLLKGNEQVSAFDFVCKFIANIEPEKFHTMFEYVDE